MAQLIRPRTPPKQRRALSAKSWEILHKLDATLLDEDERKRRDYKSLRRELNQVPRAERGMDWTERVVALYCVKREKIGRSAALKINLRLARLEAGQTEELETFLARLRETIAPMVLTNHGLQLPFSNMNQDEIARDLLGVFDLLERLGYQSFINSGTLLGAVREGQFLGHDDDADLAVLLDAKTDEELPQRLEELLDALNSDGSLLKPAWYHKNGPVLKILVGSGIEVDLFPLWMREGKAHIWPHTYGDLNAEDIFPLSTQTLCGAEMPAPKNAEKMLELNYGKGWRQPDPDYYFPWNDAKLRFAKELAIFERGRKRPSVFSKLIAKLGGKTT